MSNNCSDTQHPRLVLSGLEFYVNEIYLLCTCLCLASFTYHYICVIYLVLVQTFSLLYNIPFYECTTIYSSIDGRWGGFLLLTIMDSPAVNIHIYVFGKHMYTSLSGGF